MQLKRSLIATLLPSLIFLSLPSMAQTLPNPPPTCSVDLDIDSDNDNTWLDPEESEIEEELIEMTDPGKMIMLNMDDDDLDGLPDGEDSVINGTDDRKDTAILVLKHTTTAASEAVTLTAPENSVRIYKMDGTTVVIGPGVGNSYVMQQHPKEKLIVEGLQVGKTTLKLECTGGTSDGVLVSIIKVDVTIGGVGEEKEETEGAFLSYHPGDPINILTGVGANELLPVSIKCWPTDLPSTEMVKIEAPEGFLYEKVGEEYILALAYYKASEVGQRKFFLHGHVASENLMDRSIIVTHAKSRAQDRANFTVNKVEIVVEIEDPLRNGVCSYLKQDTLKFELNGKLIDVFSDLSRLTMEDSTDPVTGADKLKVTYVPSLDQLNLTGSNTVKVDIDDNVNNHMDQVVKSFQIK